MLKLFLKLLSTYFNINKLLINPSKTQVLCVSKPNQEEQIRNIEFNLDSSQIKPSQQIRILGFHFNSKFTHETEINLLLSQLYYKYHQLLQLKQYMDFKTKVNLCNSLILSKLRYFLPFYTNAPNYQVNKFHKLLMKLARFCLGHYGFKISVKKILQRCN